MKEKLIKWLKGNSDKHKMRKGIDDLVREKLDYFYPPSKEKTDYGEMLSTSLLGSGKNAQICRFQSYFLKDDILYLVFTGKEDYTDAGVKIKTTKSLSDAGRKGKFFRQKNDGLYERRQDKLKVLSDYLKKKFDINPIYLYVQYENMAGQFKVFLFEYDPYGRRDLKK